MFKSCNIIKYKNCPKFDVLETLSVYTTKEDKDQISDQIFFYLRIQCDVIVEVKQKVW